MSDSIRFSLDPKARSPLYRQLVDQVRYAISVGDVAPGDSLPSIRQLEQQLGINRNTVRQAYLQLEGEGLVVLRQGREARVVDRPRPGAPRGAPAPSGLARDLATSFLQLSEAEGLDAVQVAEYFEDLARAHDAAHPKCAFLECSPGQAAHFAQHAEGHLGRRVLPVDLHDLRGRSGVLPASVRVVLTPHWHFGEARDLLSDRSLEVFGVLVCITAECEERLRAIDCPVVGMVVRDAESAAGYREVLGRHVRSRDIRVALADDVSALRMLAREAGALVHTSPCADTVHFVTDGRLPVQEIVFETRPEDLDGIRSAVFPSLSPPVATT